MNPSSSILLLALLLTAGGVSAQQVRLDPTGAFFTTSQPATTSSTVATTGAGPITEDAYQRHPGTRSGARRLARQLENVAFDFVLARECEARGIARSAPLLARSMGTRRLLESGRPPAQRADGNLRARFATEALRGLRTNALVGAAREVDAVALRALFDHRFGVDGVRVRVRHILIRNETDNARSRAEALHARLQQGEDFVALLPQSQDRTTRRLLRDPAHATDAGIIAGYNYGHYGEAFAIAVRALAVGGISPPVQSPVGYHLIQLVDRKVTEFDRAHDALKKELGGGKATRSEINALRSRLLAKYEFRITIDLAATAATAVAEPPANEPDEWPHYRGNPRLHGLATGRIGAKPELAWTFATKGEILSSPVIVDGTAYIGSTDNSVYAIDMATGKQRWAYATKDMVEAPPLVLDGRVYIGSSDFFLYALDAATGKLIWQAETGDKILGGANWFRSKAGDKRIVVGSYDARVYCFDQAGNQLWSYETDNYVHGSPAVANGEVIFGGCDAALHLVDTETGNGIAKVEIGSGCQIAGSVALGGDKAYFGHYGNEFVCVDLDSGEVEWRYPGKRQGFCSSPALSDKHVVFGGRDKQLHCVLRADGTPQWTFKTRRKVDASPVICGDKVVFGSGDGRIYLLRLADGKQLWSYDIGRPVFSSPAVVDGMILIGASDHRVYAFRAPVEREK